jgi:hypothetical protein
MDVRPQIFVSSTYEDLIDERQAVTQILLESECFPAGMELFPAGDEDKMDLIRGIIDDSDYYMLILGGKYGSIDPDTNLSYTEMEYDYAISTKKPVMAFVVKDIGDLAARRVETDPKNAERLRKFRDKVLKPRTVRFYSDKKELSSMVATSLPRMHRVNKPIGWVRGNHAITPELAQELADLRAKNAELRAQNAELRVEQSSTLVVAASPIFPDLEDGEDKIRVDLMTTLWDSFNEGRGVQSSSFMTWNEIFAGVAPKLLGETPKESLEQSILNFAVNYANRSNTLPTNTHEWTVGDTEVISPEFADQVVVQFLALGLISRGARPRDASDHRTYLVLTPSGNDRMMQLNARRKQPAERLP